MTYRKQCQEEREASLHDASEPFDPEWLSDKSISIPWILHPMIERSFELDGMFLNGIASFYSGHRIRTSSFIQKCHYIQDGLALKPGHHCCSKVA